MTNSYIGCLLFQSSWYHMKSVKFSATPEGLSLSAVSDSDLGSKMASFAHTASKLGADCRHVSELSIWDAHHLETNHGKPKFERIPKCNLWPHPTWAPPGPLLSRHLNVVVGGGSDGTASGAAVRGGVGGGVRVRKLPKNPLELGDLASPQWVP
jgi:hypothetical protein